MTEAQHPGHRLRRDFLEPLGISPSRLARGLGVSRSTISRLLAGKHPLTPTLAAKLGTYFNVPARWWLLMQAEHDAAMVAHDPALTDAITPLQLDPDVLLTPKGVLRLDATVTSRDQERVSISRQELDALPTLPSNPITRVVRTIQYEDGSVALTGEGS